MTSPLAHEPALLQQDFDDDGDQPDDLFGSSDSEDQVQCALTSSSHARLLLPTGHSGSGTQGETSRTRSDDPSSSMVKSPTLRVRSSLSPHTARANPEHAPPSPSSSTGKGRKPKEPLPVWPTRSRSSTPLPPARFAPSAGETSTLTAEMRNEAQRKRRTVLERATVGDVELTQRAKRQRLEAPDKVARREAAAVAAATSPTAASQQPLEALSVVRADGSLDIDAFLSISADLPVNAGFFDPLNALASTALAAGPAPPSGAATPGSLDAASPTSNQDLLANALAMANDAQSQASSSAAATPRAPVTSLEDLLGGIDAPWLSDPLAALPDASSSILSSTPSTSAAASGAAAEVASGTNAKVSPMPYDDIITREVRRGAKMGGAAKTRAQENLQRALKAQEAASVGATPSPIVGAAAQRRERRRRAKSAAASRQRTSRSASSASGSASPPRSSNANDDPEEGEAGEKNDETNEASSSGVRTPRASKKRFAPVVQKTSKNLSRTDLRAAVLERVAARRASVSSNSSRSRSARASPAPSAATATQTDALSSVLTHRIEAAETAQERLTASLFRLKVDQHVLASARQAVDERIVAIGQQRLNRSGAITAVTRGKGKARGNSAAASASGAGTSSAADRSTSSISSTSREQHTTPDVPPLSAPPPLQQTAPRDEEVNVFNVFDEILTGAFEAESHLSDGLY